MSQLSIAVLLAIVVKSLVDYLLAPVKNKYPNMSFWWAVYLNFAAGLAVGWFSGVDFFAEYISAGILSRVLSAACVGGGATLIYDMLKAFKEIATTLKDLRIQDAETDFSDLDAPEAE